MRGGQRDPAERGEARSRGNRGTHPGRYLTSPVQRLQLPQAVEDHRAARVTAGYRARADRAAFLRLTDRNTAKFSEIRGCPVVWHSKRSADHESIIPFSALGVRGASDRATDRRAPRDKVQHATDARRIAAVARPQRRRQGSPGGRAPSRNRARSRHRATSRRRAGPARPSRRAPMALAGGSGRERAGRGDRRVPHRSPGPPLSGRRTGDRDRLVAEA